MIRFGKNSVISIYICVYSFLCYIKRTASTYLQFIFMILFFSVSMSTTLDSKVKLLLNRLPEPLTISFMDWLENILLPHICMLRSPRIIFCTVLEMMCFFPIVHEVRNTMPTG